TRRRVSAIKETLMKSLRHLWGREDGVTAIEFAVVAPVLLLLMFGIVEFSLIMLVNSVMESATMMTSRLGKTGYVGEGLSREQTLLAAVRQRAGALIDPDRLSVASEYYAQFDQIGDAEPWNDANGNGLAE